MPKALIARIAQGIVVLGFGLAVFAQVVEAKTPVLSITTTVERGNFVSISAGTKWKSKPVVVEVGVKSKKTWKWSRVASGRTDKSGKTTMCSARTLNTSTQLRVKSGAKVISTIKISRTIALSGCGYVPPTAPASTVAPSGVASTPSAPVVTTPPQPVNTTVPSTTTVPPTTVPSTTTVPPTTVPPTTTTTLPPPTPAPTALALSVETDTGDSQSDGITKATNLVVVGSAQANSSVQVYVDGVVSGSACTADGSGVFSCSLGTVTEGTKSVTAKATGVNGESVASQAFTIVVDRTKPTVSWSPNGNLWGGATQDFPFTFTVSEVTTTLSVQDVRMVCTITNACAISGFTGSGRNYSVTFSTIDNFGNGGVLGLFADSFADVAGNTNDFSNGATIMFDTSGPQATLSYVDGYMHITFSEIPVGFNVEKLEFIVMFNGQRFYGLGPGSGFNYFAAVGTSRRVWRFIPFYSDTVSEGYGYQIEVNTLADVDGNYSYPSLLDWP